MDVVVAERAVLDRVRRVPGLLQGAVAERVGVDDHGAALRQVADVRAQRRRVHHDEHVRAVAGREDVVIGEMHLEARDAGERAGRRADLGREVGERREVVAERRGLAREAVARELHPVTRVAREADDHPVELLDLLPEPLDARRSTHTLGSGGGELQAQTTADSPVAGRAGCPRPRPRRRARRRRPRRPTRGSGAPHRPACSLRPQCGSRAAPRSSPRRAPRDDARPPPPRAPRHTPWACPQSTSPVRGAPEGVEARLALAVERDQPGLPAAEPFLVPEEEPEEEVDSRMPPSERDGLRQVRRLLRVRDAEDLIGGVRLVAVLGDPDPHLLPVEAVELLHEHVEVPERDRGRRLSARARPRLRRRRLRRRAVVRVVRIRVEAARASGAHRAEERDGRDRLAARARVVVAARAGRAAGDLRGALHRLDALHDGVADPRVVAPRSGSPTCCRRACTAA